MIMLIQQVCLVTMYSKKKKNLFHHRKSDIKAGLLLTIFDFNGRSVAFLYQNYMELFPARQLNYMQSVIVANGKRQIGADSG